MPTPCDSVDLAAETERKAIIAKLATLTFSELVQVSGAITEIEYRRYLRNRRLSQNSVKLE